MCSRCSSSSRSRSRGSRRSGHAGVFGSCCSVANLYPRLQGICQKSFLDSNLRWRAPPRWRTGQMVVGRWASRRRCRGQTTSAEATKRFPSVPIRKYPDFSALEHFQLKLSQGLPRQRRKSNPSHPETSKPLGGVVCGKNRGSDVENCRAAIFAAIHLLGAKRPHHGRATIGSHGAEELLLRTS